jgi:hypothetical protein
MTSSFRLQQRKKDNLWNFGPYWTHYIKDQPGADCYPGDTAIPIGQPDGVKVCIKTPEAKSNYLQYITQPELQGYNRFSADLYDPTKKVATQISDLWKYKWRRMPNEPYNISHDYVRLPIKYNSTGTEALYQLDKNNVPFYFYGVDEINKPEENYDVTRLHQLSSLYRYDESRYHIKPQNIKYSGNKLASDCTGAP